MTEVYSSPKSSSVPGPDLPYAVADAALVEDGHGGVVLVGGTDGAKELSSLYRLEHAGKDATWCQCYKTFYGRNLQIFVIS